MRLTNNKLYILQKTPLEAIVPVSHQFFQPFLWDSLPCLFAGRPRYFLRCLDAFMSRSSFPLNSLIGKFRIGQAGPSQTALPPSFFVPPLQISLKHLWGVFRVFKSQVLRNGFKKAKCRHTFDRKCTWDIYDIGHYDICQKICLVFFFFHFWICFFPPNVVYYITYKTAII